MGGKRKRLRNTGIDGRGIREDDVVSRTKYYQIENATLLMNWLIHMLD